MMQKVCIPAEKHDKKNIERLLGIALEFSEATGLSIFELQLSMVTESFIKELEGKGFFIYRTPRSPLPLKTGANTIAIPTIGVKGRLNNEAILYLKGKGIAGNLGFSILTIMLRDGSKKEKPEYFLSNRLYRGKKSWLSISTDYSLQGDVKTGSLQKLYALTRNKYDYELLFYPVENVLYFSKKSQELPSIKAFSSMGEFIRAKRITTIQITGFTRNELAKMGKRNYERTILMLMQEYERKCNKN